MVSLIERFRADIMGVVLNSCSPRDAAQRYGYGYYHDARARKKASAVDLSPIADDAMPPPPDGSRVPGSPPTPPRRPRAPSPGTATRRRGVRRGSDRGRHPAVPTDRVSATGVSNPEPRRRSVLQRIGGRAIAMWALVAASAVAAAASPARPTGLRAADVVWCGLLGAAVPLVASRSRRLPLVWAGGIAAVMGIVGDVTTVVATVALLALIGVITFSDRRDRVVATALGALTVQVLLRSPSFGFVGLPTVVGAVALAPLVWSGYSMARQRERRAGVMAVLVTTAVVLVLGSAAMVTALGTRSTLADGVDLAARGLESIGAGDTPGAADRFTAAADTFQKGSDSLEGWLTWGGRLVPVVGQHVEALRRVASAGVALDRSAATTASTANYRELTADDGQVDLAAIEALQEPVASSAAIITSALHSVATVRSPWLVGSVARQLDRFGERLADAGDQAEIAAEGLAVAPALLGAEGPRQYFVAFATPGESRYGGGFAGAYGILSADAGHLELTHTGSLNALDAPDAPYGFDPPPDWNELYGSYSVDSFLGNFAASPDWPTDRGVIGQLYPQTPGGSRIDGALYLDPAAIAGLLRLTGPVVVPELETTLDAGNAERFLLQDQYVLIGGNNPQRKELLGEAARATFDALTSRPLPGIATLTDVLGGLVDAGHLRMSVDDPVSEAFLDRVGLAGQWDDPSGHRLRVVAVGEPAGQQDRLVHPSRRRGQRDRRSRDRHRRPEGHGDRPQRRPTRGSAARTSSATSSGSLSAPARTSSPCTTPTSSTA